MYITFATIDGWHLDGTHCPSANIYPQLSNENDDDYFSRIGHEFVRFGYKTSKQMSVDKDFIISHLEKDGYCRIHFTYPREGYVIVWRDK